MASTHGSGGFYRDQTTAINNANFPLQLSQESSSKNWVRVNSPGTPSSTAMTQENQDLINLRNRMRQSNIPLGTGQLKDKSRLSAMESSQIKQLAVCSSEMSLTKKVQRRDIANNVTHLPFQWNVKQASHINYNHFGTMYEMTSSGSKFLNKEALTGQVHYNNDTCQVYARAPKASRLAWL